MKASVVVVTYNRQAVLSSTLTCLLRQDCVNYEVIVVDQTPAVSQELRAFLEKCGSIIRYFVLPLPNLPVARNFGIAQARADVVIFVDDDVVVPPSFVSGHVRNFHDKTIGGVTGLTLTGTEGTVRDALNSLQSVHDAAGPLGTDQVVDVSWVPGCNMSFRRDVLAEVEGFDEHLPGNSICDDVDISLRIRAAGYRLIADTGVQLVHLALRNGGCDTRNDELTEEKAREAFRLAVYCWMKNWRSLGLAQCGRLLFRAYRSYALNWMSLNRGLLWKRHCAAALEVANMIVLLRKPRTGKEAVAARPSS